MSNQQDDVQPNITSNIEEYAELLLPSIEDINEMFDSMVEAFSSIEIDPEDYAHLQVLYELVVPTIRGMTELVWTLAQSAQTWDLDEDSDPGALWGAMSVLHVLSSFWNHAATVIDDLGEPSATAQRDLFKKAGLEVQAVSTLSDEFKAATAKAYASIQKTTEA